MEEFTQKCQEEINKGHLVCIFPEGQISRIGHLLEFKKGVEYISEGIEAPIIPIYLAGLKGIPFSFDIGGSRPRLKLSSFKHHVLVNIGKAIYHRQSAFHLRQRIQELTAEAFDSSIKDHYTLPFFFMRKAKSKGRKAIVFGKEQELTYKHLCQKSFEISEILKSKFPQYQYLGVCLTDPFEQVLFNIGIAVAGKTSINYALPQIGKFKYECDVIIVDQHFKNIGTPGVPRILINDIINGGDCDKFCKPDVDEAILKSRARISSPLLMTPLTPRRASPLILMTTFTERVRNLLGQVERTGRAGMTEGAIKGLRMHRMGKGDLAVAGIQDDRFRRLD